MMLKKVKIATLKSWNYDVEMSKLWQNVKIALFKSRNYDIKNLKYDIEKSKNCDFKTSKLRC